MTRIVAAAIAEERDDARVQRLEAQIQGLMNCLANCEQDKAKVWDEAIETIFEEIERQADFGMFPSNEDFRIALAAKRGEK
jgi:hypothetical protein